MAYRMSSNKRPRGGSAPGGGKSYSFGGKRSQSDSPSQNLLCCSCELKQRLNDDAESLRICAASCSKIQHHLAEVKPYRGGQSIFKVPSNLRALEPVAFEPHLVSIGPYHRNDEHLKEMEKHKWWILKQVLERNKLPIHSLVKEMYQLVERTRNCYEQLNIGFNSEELMEMMLLDGCFILELLHLSANLDGWKELSYGSDPLVLLNLRGFLPIIQRDLLMLENQLPFFVLEKLVILAWKVKANDSVATLALRFFDGVSLISGISNNPRSQPPQWLHLLHIVRVSLDPTKPVVKRQDREATHHETRLTVSSNLPVMHSVTDLRGTGIQFREKEKSKFTDVEFKEGVLLIPSLLIDGSTKSIFLNLMAFEQCYPSCRGYVTSYISFMDGLINTPMDVDHLYKKQIIVHEMGSQEDVATLFNNLRKEIVFDTSEYYLEEVSNGLNKHYEQKWRSWKATLKHEYLKDPWKIFSLMAAGFLIFLTATQTVYTMVGYHLPR